MIVSIKLPINTYRVHIDGASITLSVVKLVQDVNSKNYGEEHEKDIGYFTQIPNAFKRIVKEELGDEKVTVNVKEFLKRFKAIEDSINEQFKQIEA